jgi:RNA polymerase primary sigma factor
MCGLLTAAHRFDPGRGVKFWTYARFWVLAAIRHSIVEHSRLVHIPTYLIRMINQATIALSAILGRLPTITELAEALEIDTDICERALQALDRPVSLSAPAELEDAPLSEVVPDASAGDPETLALDGAAREELDRLLDVLPARERVILRGRFGLDGPARTFEELAQMCALSSARVRQLYRLALARLRDITSSERAKWVRLIRLPNP